MTNNKLKFIVAIASVLPLLVFGNLVLASEWTYQLNAGMGTPTVNGTVTVPPTANPGTGTYTSTQSVVLTANGSSSIHYTIDGSSPTCSTGTVYAGAISVSSSEVITAISCYQDNVSYPLLVATFGYAIVPVVAPVVTPVVTQTVVSGGGGGSYTPPTTAKVGDINSDGKVDKYDFATLMSQWGQTGTTLTADLNHDGKVDKYDFALLMANWGS
jgi:hypothetical protein